MTDPTPGSTSSFFSFLFRLQDTELVDDDAAASSDFLGAAFLRTTTTSLSRQTSTSSKADERRIRQERLREEKRVAKEQRRAETERRKQEALARKDEEVRRRALQREITPTQDPQRMMRSLVCLLDEDILKVRAADSGVALDGRQISGLCTHTVHLVPCRSCRPKSTRH